MRRMSEYRSLWQSYWRMARYGLPLYHIYPFMVCLLCSNHSSYLDGPLLASALNTGVLLETYFMGFAEIFNHPALKWARRIARLIPIDPALNLIQTLRACNFILENSKVICIFPEGARSRDGSIKEFKRGIGILIKGY